jgi:hypothetical protein
MRGVDPIRRRDSIQWDYEMPHYLVVVPQGYSDINAQELLGFYGDIKGANVTLKRVGQDLHGHRFSNLVLVDVIPDPDNLWWDYQVATRFLSPIEVL